MTLAGCLTLVLPPRYTATVQILLDPKRSGAIGSDGEFSNAVVDTIKINSVTSVIQSQDLLERVVKSEKLSDLQDYSDGGMSGSIFRRISAFVLGSTPQAANDALKIARAVDRVKAGLAITRDGFTYVISVNFTARDPALAARIAKSIGDTYLNDQLEAKYDSIHRASLWLADRLHDLGADLKQSEENVAKIRQTYGLTEGATSTVDRQQVTEYNTQLINAQAELVAKQSKFDQIRRIQQEGGDLESLPEVAASSVISNLRAQQADTSRQVAELSQRYGARHPEVLRAAEARQSVNRQISAEVGRIVATLKNDYETANKRVQSLQAQMNKLTGADSVASSDGQARLTEAMRVAEANKQLYDNFLGKFKESEQRETFQEAEARIIAQARVPEAASFPKLSVFLAVSGGLGFVLGIGLAVLLEQMESSFTTAGQIEALLKLPVLASIPLMNSTDLVKDGKVINIVEYAADKKFSRFSESFRSIRVALTMVDVDQPPRVIQLTSSVPGEGKSTLAAVLAMSSAQAGVKTLLIDCDFRHPSASRIFNLTSRSGLIDLLLGTVRLEDVIHVDERFPLSVLPGGSGAKSPPDLIQSKRMQEIVQLASKHFDLVIIDSPPVEVVSDALVISGLVEKTLFVVEWHGTAREIIMQAVNHIHQANGSVAGVVLNKVDFRRMSAYGYGYGYGYGDGYGYGKYYRQAEKYYTN